MDKYLIMLANSIKTQTLQNCYRRIALLLLLWFSYGATHTWVVYFCHNRWWFDFFIEAFLVFYGNIHKQKQKKKKKTWSLHSTWNGTPTIDYVPSQTKRFPRVSLHSCQLNRASKTVPGATSAQWPLLQKSSFSFIHLPAFSLGDGLCVILLVPSWKCLF